MKNLEFVELNAQEMEEVNGGSLLIAWAVQLYCQGKAAKVLAQCVIGAYEAGYEAGRSVN